MMTTYNVRIWKTVVYKGQRVTTYYIRWTVDGKEFKEPYRNKAQAESFRSDLVSAARKGEAFYIATGLPVSMARANERLSWYEFACNYADLKWPHVAATTRRTHAEALTAITMLLVTTDRGKPDDKLLRMALKRWAFNTPRRDDPNQPEHVRAALRWVAGHTKQVSALSDPTVLRGLLDGLAVCLDGMPRSPSVVTRWRKILNNAFEYAVDEKLLAVNPLPALRRKPVRVIQVHAVDRRVVANPVQVRTLLRAVGEQEPSGPRLVAFYGCLYFAGMRPEEAAALAKPNLSLPATGWGELHLERAKPYAGKEWTNTGEARDDRQLKQREINEVRTVPCPPELTALLHTHLERFGTGPNDRLFVGERNREHLPTLTVTRVWARARAAAFTEEVAASPLARTPYDLRHAAVSTWLNAGVPPTKVAEWAGHSIEVLLKIYAKCIDGEDAKLRSQVQSALGHDPTQKNDLQRTASRQEILDSA
jgi:integrase